VLLVSGLGLVGLWEYYSMLDVKKLPNFKMFGMFCGALMLGGSFYWLGWRGAMPDSIYDFEIGTLLLFLLVVFARQMFVRVVELVPLETMALTLFGLFYVPWPFSFVAKIVYLTPRLDGHVTGHFYVLFLVLVTKFSDMGAYITGSLIGKHPLVPHISPKKNVGGIFRRAGLQRRRRMRVGRPDAGKAALPAAVGRGDSRAHPRLRGDRRRSGGVVAEAQLRSEGQRALPPRHRRRARPH
jgi:CDP-diglyceride synthetase